VAGARSLTLGERGTLFVGSSEGSVYAVPAGGGAPRAIARTLNAPHGVAFHDGALYVGENGRITRYDAIESHLREARRIIASKRKLAASRAAS
jgi:glucose/arabinose dehydrogenase